jgi:hypothetical protein
LKVTRYRTSPNGYLQIRKASEEEDSGNYTCVAQNTVGTSSVSIRVDVGSQKRNILYFDFILFIFFFFKLNQQSLFLSKKFTLK